MEIYTVRNVEKKIKFACKILHYQAFIYLYSDILKVSIYIYLVHTFQIKFCTALCTKLLERKIYIEFCNFEFSTLSVTPSGKNIIETATPS